MQFGLPVFRKKRLYVRVRASLFIIVRDCVKASITVLQQMMIKKKRWIIRFIFYSMKVDWRRCFYYMGQLDIIDIKEAEKENNKGKKEVISKVQVKMQRPVRDDLLRYLQSVVLS